MDWNEVQKEKKELMREVVEDLNEVERGFLVWLLREEKRNRAMGKGWQYKNPIRERLASVVGEK